MFNKKFLLCLTLIILSLSIVNAIPGSWKGYVTVNGSFAITGTNVSALLNNVHKTTVQTGSGGPNSDAKNGSYYDISVEGTNSDTVILQVNGINASTQTWAIGPHNLNLSVNKSTTTTPCTYSAACNEGYCCSGGTEVNDGVTGGATCQSTACSSGSSGGGGGGGGGGSSGGGGGGGGAGLPQEWTPVTDTSVQEALGTTVPSEWTQVNYEQAVATTVDIVKVEEQSVVAIESLVSSQDAINAINSIQDALANNEVQQTEIKRTMTILRIINPLSGDTRHRTEIKITVNGGAEGKENVEIIEVIPKSVAASINEVIFPKAKPVILQSDPVIQWIIEKIKAGETKELIYIVKKKLDKDDGKAIGVEDVVEKEAEAEPEEVKPTEEVTPVEEPKKQVNMLALLIGALVIIVLIALWIIYKKKHQVKH